MTLQEMTIELQQALDATPDPYGTRGLSRQEQEEYGARRQHLAWQTTQAQLHASRLAELDKELGELRPWREMLVTVRAEMEAELAALQPLATTVSVPPGYEALKLGIQVCDRGAMYVSGVALTGALVNYLQRHGVEPLPGERSLTNGRRLSIRSCDERISKLEAQRSQVQQQWNELERFVAAQPVSAASS